MCYNNFVEGVNMISALIGLQTATAMSYNAFSNMALFYNHCTKSGQLRCIRNRTLYKMAQAQQNYYRKLLDKNIKSSFSIFA